jgi:hypothetical protein
MDKLEWTETDQPLPEVQQIIDIMSVTGGIDDVKVMRVAEEPNTVTQVGDEEGRFEGGDSFCLLDEGSDCAEHERGSQRGVGTSMQTLSDH